MEIPAVTQAAVSRELMHALCSAPLHTAVAAVHSRWSVIDTELTPSSHVFLFMADH